MIGIHHGCDAVDKSAIWDEWKREWACSYVVCARIYLCNMYAPAFVWSDLTQFSISDH